jgi:hypothetical protein
LNALKHNKTTGVPLENQKTPNHIHEFSDLRDSQIGVEKPTPVDSVPAVLRGSLSESVADPEFVAPEFSQFDDKLQEYQTWVQYYNLALTNLIRSGLNSDAVHCSIRAAQYADVSIDALKRKWKQLSEDSTPSSIPKT